MNEKTGQNDAAEKKRGKKKWMLAAAVVAVAVLAAVLIFTLHGGGKDNDIPIGKESAAERASGEIQTPVGVLTFPAEWADRVWTEDASSGDQYTEKFYGSAGKDEVLLFEISVGADGVGYRLGSAPDENGAQRELWLNISEIEPKSAWTEQQISQINLMQGCVNDLIEQVRALDGFREDG